MEQHRTPAPDGAKAPTVLLVVGGNGEVVYTVEDLAAIADKYQIPDVSLLDERRQGHGVHFAGLVEESASEQSTSEPSAIADKQMVRIVCSRDNYRVELPVSELLSRAVLLFRDAAGNPLPAEYGGPVRFFIPQYTDCGVSQLDACANVKGVDRLEFYSLDS